MIINIAEAGTGIRLSFFIIAAAFMATAFLRAELPKTLPPGVTKVPVEISGGKKTDPRDGSGGRNKNVRASIRRFHRVRCGPRHVDDGARSVSSGAGATADVVSPEI